MPRIGTTRHPAILRVASQERAAEVSALCDAHGIHFILGLEPDQDEDISDLDRALNPPDPVVRTIAKVGRNEPCPCGSGRKVKKCHAELSA